jgi:16S rRNA (cytidine1402-2'-O)-methyltransferase
MHEEFLRGTAAEIRATLMARESVKGEIALLIGKRTGAAEDNTPLAEAVEACVAQGMGRMEAIKTVAHRRGLSKREVYGEVERGKGR